MKRVAKQTFMRAYDPELIDIEDRISQFISKNKELKDQLLDTHSTTT
jgi:hypothetical protein